jgi:hypothetical protein
MKKFSKKGVLLFAGAMAVCAFAMPSMASAASWSVIGSHHTLNSPNIGFVTHTGLSSSCTNSSFTTRVDSAQVLTITTGTFAGCTSSFPAAGADCLTTSQGTGFPWIATAVTTTSIQIHRVHIDIRFEDMPGRAGSCGPLANTNTTLSGTLSGGHWNPAVREVVWTAGTGLVSSTAGAVTVGGTFRDAQQTLVVNP